MTDELHIKPPVDPKNTNYYVNKDELRDALRDYRDDCLRAEEAGETIPEVTRYIGESILQIATGLSQKYNFRNYSFVNDMIMDGVVQCLKYIRSFDPDMVSKRTNAPVSPLAYFTQTCFYAFINRIKVEKEQSKAKWALLTTADLTQYINQDEDGEFTIGLEEFILQLGPQEFLEVEKKEPKIKKEKPSPLDEFL